MNKQILCHKCGHDIDIHDWENGCPDCKLGSLTSSRCILKPSDIARTIMTAAAEALERVRVIHQDGGESQGYTDHGYGDITHSCTTCGTHGEYGEPWPCPTIRAIDGEEQA